MSQEIRGSFADLSSILNQPEQPPLLEETTTILHSPAKSPNGAPVRRRRITRRCKIRRFPLGNSGPNCCALAESSISSNGSDTDGSITSGRNKRSRNTHRRWEVNIYSDGQKECIASKDLQKLCQKLNSLEQSCCLDGSMPCEDPCFRVKDFTNDFCKATVRCFNKLFQPWTWRPDRYSTPPSTASPKSTQFHRRHKRSTTIPPNEVSSESSYGSVDSSDVSPASMAIFFIILVVLAIAVIMGIVYIIKNPDLLQHRAEWSTSKSKGVYSIDNEIPTAISCCGREADRCGIELDLDDKTSENVKKFEDYFKKRVGQMAETL